MPVKTPNVARLPSVLEALSVVMLAMSEFVVVAFVVEALSVVKLPFGAKSDKKVKLSAFTVN